MSVVVLLVFIDVTIMCAVAHGALRAAILIPKPAGDRSQPSEWRLCRPIEIYTFPRDIRARYDRNIACITHHPYTQGNSDFDGDVARWPDVAYVDVVNNIILNQSPSRSRLRLRRWS